MAELNFKEFLRSNGALKAWVGYRLETLTKPDVLAYELDDNMPASWILLAFPLGKTAEGVWYWEGLLGEWAGMVHPDPSSGDDAVMGMGGNDELALRITLAELEDGNETA